MNLTQLLVTQKNVDALSAQFGLNEEQTLEALDALIPAFSTGLRRNTSSPQGAAGLIQALATGRHGHYVDDPVNAMSSYGVSEGNAILGHLFGNKDVSRAVAGHAAASSGISSSILKSMLPVIASMVMGSLFKGAKNSARGGGLGGALGQAAGGGILGQLIEGLAGGMLGGGGPQHRQRRAPRRRTSQRPQGGGLEDLLGDLLGGGQRTRQRPTRHQPRQADPIMPTPRRRHGGGSRGRNAGGSVFDEFLGQAPTNQPQRRRQNPYAQQETPRRRAPRTPRGGGGLGDIFGEMLNSGSRRGSEYEQETGSVFDEFLGRN